MNEISPSFDYISIDIIVLTLLVLTAMVAISMRDLLASAIMLSIFSLLMALMYLLLDAPDVALTEAAVGAGISTVLFLLALNFTEREAKPAPTSQRITALLVVIITGSLLLYASEELPPFASPDAPIHHHVAPYYIEQMRHDIDIPNLVTAILASYRGFDTMGEVAVIFTAGIGMAALLMNLPQLRQIPLRSGPPTNPAPKNAKPTETVVARNKKPAAKKTAPKKTTGKGRKA